MKLAFLLTTVLISNSFCFSDQMTTRQEPPAPSDTKSSGRTAQIPTDVNRQVLEQLDKETASGKAEWENCQRELTEFRFAEELFACHEDSSAITYLITLRRLTTEQEMLMLEKKSEWESLQEAKPEELPVTGDLQAMLANDSRLMRLEDRQLQAEEDVAVASAKATGDENHRDVKAAKSVRDFIADQLTAEHAQKLTRLQAERIASARHDYLACTEQCLKLKERLFNAEQELRDRDAKQWRYRMMLEECNRFKSRYERLLEEKQSLGRLPRLLETLKALQHTMIASKDDVDISVTLDLDKPDAGPQVTFKLSKPAAARKTPAP